MTVRISVREARFDDAGEVIEVVRDSITRLCVVDHHNEPALLHAWLANKTPENFRLWLSNPENYCIVAEADAICGVGLLHQSGEIRLLYVSPKVQRRGVGGALLAQLESQAREMGLSRLRLTSTAAARCFYDSMGYRDCGESELWQGIVCYKYDRLIVP
jgi:N-acetylglutamate synthase-like GNAT family acetyltransferase